MHAHVRQLLHAIVGKKYRYCLCLSNRTNETECSSSSYEERSVLFVRLCKKWM
jgi:hypothetical protein